MDFAALVSNAASSSVVIMYIRSQITVNFSFYDDFSNNIIICKCNMNGHQATTQYDPKQHEECQCQVKSGY